MNHGFHCGYCHISSNGHASMEDALEALRKHQLGHTGNRWEDLQSCAEAGCDERACAEAGHRLVRRHPQLPGSYPACLCGAVRPKRKHNRR